MSEPQSPVIALVGNPNTGKSTLFNRLTGARQKVGNYPGVTVEKKIGTLELGETSSTLIDLPGTYSLAPTSQDEQIVLDLLCGYRTDLPRPDAILCIVDATNLRRNLFFASQAAETGLPLVIALNMIDEAEKNGIWIDANALSEKLGVPVVPTVAAKGYGLDELKRVLEKALRSRPLFSPVPWPESIRSALRELEGANPAERVRLLFDLESELPGRWKEKGIDLSSRLADAREKLRRDGLDPVRIEAELRYAHLDRLLEGIVKGESKEVSPTTDRLDRVLTHRVFGLLIFVLLMMGVFSSIYWLAGPLMNGIDAFFGWIGGWAGGKLEGSPVWKSLVVDGILTGVGGVVIFLPQILILFFFMALLEDSGYMARAAFLMDKVFSWTGLNGKSFVPMLASFACAIPAIMSARAIEDPKARITTILIAPLMSCSARLPVYVLLIGAFVEPQVGALGAGAVLFAMHLLGLFLGLPIAFVMNRFFLKLKSIPFVLELPAYRRPRFRDVFHRMYRSGREFTIRAGTVIFLFSIVIWALSYFPRSESVADSVAKEVGREYGITPDQAKSRLEGDLSGRLDSAFIEASYLGRMGKAIQPVFALAGYDWKITVGIIASFPAREVIVSTLGILYNLEEDRREEAGALGDKLRAAKWPDGSNVFSPSVALSLMVFFALCMQCGSTVAVIGREIGWRWATFSFTYMTILAWVAAVLIYQGGKLL
jgi:ferrous iron transport protein B